MLKKTVIIVALLLLAGVVAGCGSLKTDIVDNGASDDNVQKIVDSFISKSAPDFTLKQADGTEVTLSKMQGKPVVLNFWATWCPYCIAEFEHFTKAQENFKEIQFLAVDTLEKTDFSGQDAQKEIEKFAQEKGFDLPIVFDVDGAVYEQKYATQGLPSTFLIDSQGNVRLSIPGAVLDYETLETMLKALVKAG